MHLSEDEYKRALLRTGEGQLILYLDLIESLLRAGFPVWRAVQRWGHHMMTIYGQAHENDWICIDLANHAPSTTIEWPPSIAEDLSAVRKIELSPAALPELPAWIGHLPELTDLEIRDCLNDELMQLNSDGISMVYTHTTWNKTEDGKGEYHRMMRPLPPLVIPAWLAEAPQLKRLSISNRKFQVQFDSEFCRQSQIRDLSISTTLLLSPLTDFEYLSRLESLFLGDIKEKTIFSQNNSHRYPELRELYLGNIISFDSLNILSTFSNIAVLSLHSPLFHEFPTIFRQFSLLERIYVYAPQNLAIPDWISELKALKYLIISDILDPLNTLKNDQDVIKPIEFQPSLRDCTQLVWIEIPTTPEAPIRSLENLPPLAQYFLALNAAYPEPNTRYHFQLPPSVYQTIHFEMLRSPGPPIPDFEYYGPINAGRASVSLPTYDYHKLDTLAHYNHQPQCIVCNWPLRASRCSNERCHIDYYMAPSMHPALAQFLQMYYRDSFDTLFQRVRRGESLSVSEQERFIHEIDYHYWQLLLNAGIDQIHDSIREQLVEKFSMKLRTGDRILL